MADLGSLRVFLTADASKFNKTMNLARTGVKTFAKGVASAAAVATSFIGTGVGMLAMFDRMATVGDDIGKGAKRIGVTTEAFQKLEFAAERSGAGMGSIEKAFKRMASTIFDANQGLAESQRALGAIGLSAEQLQGLSPEEQFLKIADSLNRVEDASTKAALAQDIFGRAGTQLIPMIGDYRALADEAERMGLITDENVKAAERYKDAMKNLTQSAQAFVQNSGLLSYMTDVVEEMDALVKIMRGADFTLDESAPTLDEINRMRAAQGKDPLGANLRVMPKAAIKQDTTISQIDKLLKMARKEAPAADARVARREAMFQATDNFYKGMQLFNDFVKGDIKFAETFAGDFVDTMAKEENTARTENRLASAMEAGSREAFGLMVRGRDSQKDKREKMNLKANETTADYTQIIAEQGVTLRDVAVIDSI